MLPTRLLRPTLVALRPQPVRLQSTRRLFLAGSGRWLHHIAHLDEFVLDLALIFPQKSALLSVLLWVSVMIDSQLTRTVLALFVRV